MWPVFGILSSGAGRWRRGAWAKNWFHDTACAGRRSGAEPHQTANPGSRAASFGASERRVVDCDQSAEKSSGVPVSGDRAGDRPSLSALQFVIAGALRCYKVALSPMLPSSCRFYPTCSAYMHEAVIKYGAGRGVWLGLKRLVKCHPFHHGGVDRVP